MQPPSTSGHSASAVRDGCRSAKVAIVVEDEEGGTNSDGDGAHSGGGSSTSSNSVASRSPVACTTGASRHAAAPLADDAALVASASPARAISAEPEATQDAHASAHDDPAGPPWVTLPRQRPQQPGQDTAGPPTDDVGGARVMRLKPAAPATPSLPDVTRHTLRLHPSTAAPVSNTPADAAPHQQQHQQQLPMPTPTEREEADAHEDAPPAKRLRLSLHKPPAAAAAAHSEGSGGGGGGRRILKLALPSSTGHPPAATAAAVPPPAVAVAADETPAHTSAVPPGLAHNECVRGSEEDAQRVAAVGERTAAPPTAAPTRPPPIVVDTTAATPSAAAAPGLGSPQSVPRRPVPATTTTAAAAAVSAHSPSGTAFGRLRSLTPTPYPSGSGSSGRRHRFVGVVLPAAPPPLLTDFSSIQRTVQDVYEVHDKLSEGTYGEVFKGVDKRTGAAVALKRLKMLGTHQGFPQTSLREVTALRHIQSQRERLEQRLRNDPHHSSGSGSGGSGADPLAEVSQLCDVLLFDRQHRDIVLVFAYATASLAGLCRRQCAFTPSELAYLMKKLLIAMRKLHEMRIIHRDIKSDNVLVTSEGEVQLTDFGLCSIAAAAAAPGSAASGGRVWRTPSVITLAYRPPEMLLGSTAYGEKVDVWSFGCLLAQMYMLEPPFFRHRAQQQQQQQQQQPRTAERTAATELEQLSRITEVLGPLPPVRVYQPDACQHMRVLEQLEAQGRMAESGQAAQPTNWGKLQSIFVPSFLYQQFHGFRGWFEAELQRSRHQPHRRPTQACMDVLCAALQLDPQQRPTAAELLRMPYFTTLDDAPLPGSFQRLLPVTPEREAEVRRGFMIKVQRCGDSHTQRRPPQ
ncbi:cdc2-related kinase 12 [Novymonas esmeraldas]|uniref:Cdc2-related kinase 12 n=1 Tax=Novymonas esmeraldas TaxID=1808958 RepID=A0AAW0EW55_9TRYP